MYYNQINKIVNNIFRTNNNSVLTVDQYWIQYFINRHLKLYKVKQTLLKLKKKFIYNLDMI